MKSTMPPLILVAGGMATRLHPMTLTIPKSMVNVLGEPFIVHQLRLLKREKIKEVIICIGYLGEDIKDFIQDGKKFSVKIKYSDDGKDLQGTGGAIRNALSYVGDPFWVLYGDSYLDVSFSPILNYFLEKKKCGLMTVYYNNNKFYASNVIFENGFIRHYDKKCPSPEMKYIDYGLGLFRKSAFSSLREKSKFDLSEVYRELIDQGELVGYEVQKRFYEIGSIAGLKELEHYLEKNSSVRKR